MNFPCKNCGCDTRGWDTDTRGYCDTCSKLGDVPLPRGPFCEKCGKLAYSTYLDRDGKWRHVSGYLVGDGTPPKTIAEKNVAEINT